MTKHLAESSWILGIGAVGSLGTAVVYPVALPAVLTVTVIVWLAAAAGGAYIDGGDGCASFTARLFVLIIIGIPLLSAVFVAALKWVAMQ